MVPFLFLASLSLKFLEVCITYVLQWQLILFFFWKILTSDVIQKEIFLIFLMLVRILLSVNKNFLLDEIKDFFIQPLFI